MTKEMIQAYIDAMKYRAKQHEMMDNTLLEYDYCDVADELASLLRAIERLEEKGGKF